MASSPAASRVARRRSGVLSGEPRWASRSALSDLEHHALGGSDRSELGQFVGVRGHRRWRGGAGRSRRGPAGHGREVVDGGGVAVRAEPVARGRVAQLGALAEGEERLVAARVGALGGDGQHLVGGQVRRVEPGRRLGERAVAAPVATQHGERDEHLGRVGDPGAVVRSSRIAARRGAIRSSSGSASRSSCMSDAAGSSVRPPAAARSASHTTWSPRTRLPGAVGSSLRTRSSASLFSSPLTVTTTRRARAMPCGVSVIRR